MFPPQISSQSNGEILAIGFKPSVIVSVGTPRINFLFIMAILYYFFPGGPTADHSA